MNASRICFILAWIVAAFYLYTALFAWSPRGFVACLGLATLLFIFFIWRARPEVVPGYSGTLILQSRLLFSFSQGGEIPLLEVGDSGTTFNCTAARGQPLLRVAQESSLVVESITEKVKVSAYIRDKTGKVIAELTRNDWKVAPPPGTWDRNYTNDSLEVVNAYGHVILQVRMLPDRIRLQGEWWDDQGNGLRLMKNNDPSARGSMIVVLRNGQDREPHIKPMFKYPSDRYFGELLPPESSP